MENLTEPIKITKEEFELLPEPTVILKLSPDEPEEELTNDELEIKKLKEKAMRCKVIALSQMGFHPINTNGGALHRNKKKELLRIMTELFEKPEEEVVKQFNDLVCEEVFSHQEEYKDFPIYSRSYKKKEELIENLKIN